MIFINCGIIMVILSLLFQMIKPRKDIKIYGYYSYLAAVDEKIYLYAQKIAKIYLFLCGTLQFFLGIVIHYFNLDNFVYLWIFMEVFLILFYFAVVEDFVTKKLKKENKFPIDYKNLDDREKDKIKLEKGLRK